MAGNYMKLMQEQREKRVGPGQNSPDQINLKRGHDHFLKTRKKADRPVMRKEELEMGQFLEERESKYYSMETSATLSDKEFTVREFAAEFEANALKHEGTLSREKFKVERSHQRSETLHMIRSDTESQGFASYETMVFGMQTVKALCSQPLPRFQNGASVVQWWAPWMAGAKEVLKTYNNQAASTRRPAWFKGEVLQHIGWMSIHYAGRQQNDCHVYSVH